MVMTGENVIYKQFTCSGFPNQTPKPDKPVRLLLTDHVLENKTSLPEQKYNFCLPQYSLLG